MTATPLHAVSTLVRVAVLDDHAAVRAGVEALLAGEPDLVMVGAADGEEALWPLLRRTRPSVVVLDFGRRGRDGLELCLRMKATLQPPRVVLHSGFPREALLVPSALAGVDAIAGKDGSRVELLDAIRTAGAAGEGGGGHRLTVPGHLAARAAAAVDPADHALLAMLLAGTAPDDVADTLGISRTAVHRRTGALVARLRPAREGAGRPGAPLDGAVLADAGHQRSAR
jgi:DNA-binding NarL/FixJ family response regulator